MPSIVAGAQKVLYGQSPCIERLSKHRQDTYTGGMFSDFTFKEWKMIRGRVALFAAVFLITACTALSNDRREQEYQAALTRYVGENIEQIIDKFGYADSLSESSTGNRVFVYSSFHIDSSSVRCSENSDGTHSCSGGDVDEHWCKTYFEVDSQNVIVDFSNKGNSCGSCSWGKDVICFK